MPKQKLKLGSQEGRASSSPTPPPPTATFQIRPSLGPGFTFVLSAAATKPCAEFMLLTERQTLTNTKRAYSGTWTWKNLVRSPSRRVESIKQNQPFYGASPSAWLVFPVENSTILILFPSQRYPCSLGDRLQNLPKLYQPVRFVREG